MNQADQNATTGNGAATDVRKPLQENEEAAKALAVIMAAGYTPAEVTEAMDMATQNEKGEGGSPDADKGEQVA